MKYLHWDARSTANSHGLNNETKIKGDYRKLKDSEAVLHQHGEDGKNNSKYVSIDDGRKEVVFDVEGNFVNTPENMGTYNLFGPQQPVLHGIFDVVPYYLWGNSHDDTIGFRGRIEATKRSIELRKQGK